MECTKVHSATEKLSCHSRCFVVDTGLPTGTQWQPSNITWSIVSIVGQHLFRFLVIHFLATGGQLKKGSAHTVVSPSSKMTGPFDLAIPDLKFKHLSINLALEKHIEELLSESYRSSENTLPDIYLNIQCPGSAKSAINIIFVSIDANEFFISSSDKTRMFLNM